MKNEDVTIKLSDDTSLQAALKKAGVDNLASVRKLTVTGTFNRYHFSDIFEKNNSVTELDLSSASYNAYFFKKSDFSSYYDYHYKNMKRYHVLWKDRYEIDNTLISISFPVSVEKLDSHMFSTFKKLKSIVVPDNHEYFSVENGILFSRDKTQILRYPTGLKGEYTIPDTVVEIGEHAFDRCAGLNSIVIPNSVIEIGNYAFYECKGLTSINISETVVEIGDSAFYNCNGLTSVTIPQSVEIVGDSAFAHCKRLKSVKILNPETKLGDHAFSSCENLISVDMPKSVAYRRNQVFNYCEKLPLYHDLLNEEKNNQIKRGKVKELKTLSAHDWLETLMKNSKYTYKINKSYETKLQLSVKINENTKLEIAVPYTKFQTILPKLMDAIKRYEEAVNEFDFVLVERSNTKYDKEGWINEN